MKKRFKDITAIILLILLTILLFMALTARCDGSMNPVRQQIRMEMLIQ